MSDSLRPYFHDGLSDLCKKKGFDIDRVLARASDIMRAFPGTPGATDYDAWVAQIDGEFSRERVLSRPAGEEAQRGLLVAMERVRRVSRPRHALAPFAMIAGAAQQHILDLLDSVFYLGFSGKTGSGKGTSVESTLLMCPGGGVVLSGSSPAALASALEDGCAIGVEELHKLLDRDEFIGKLFRDGYRRGPSVALMIPGEGGKGWVRGSRSLFGFKVYDFHLSIDPHLLGRTLVFPMVESSDAGLALDAEKKARHLLPVREWLATCAAEVHRVWTKDLVDELWDSTEFRERVISLKGRTGRDHVLGATLLLLCRLFGWASYETKIPDLLETRKSVADLSDEGEVRDAIHALAGDDPSPDYVISTTHLLERLNEGRKRTSQKPLTSKKLGDCLTDLGFVRGEPKEAGVSWWRSKEAATRDLWVISPYKAAHEAHPAQTTLDGGSSPAGSGSGPSEGPDGPDGPGSMGGLGPVMGRIGPGEGVPEEDLGLGTTRADRARERLERGGE